jgi:arginyl-tRNA synthetase
MCDRSPGAMILPIWPTIATTLAKSYHRFWHDLSVFNAETPAAKAFRLQLSRAVGQVLTAGIALLGIEVPERM